MILAFLILESLWFGQSVNFFIKRFAHNGSWIWTGIYTDTLECKHRDLSILCTGCTKMWCDFRIFLDLFLKASKALLNQYIRLYMMDHHYSIFNRIKKKFIKSLLFETNFPLYYKKKIVGYYLLRLFFAPHTFIWFFVFAWFFVINKGIRETITYMYSFVSHCIGAWHVCRQNTEMLYACILGY